MDAPFPRPSAWNWLRAHPYSAGGAVLLLGLAVPFLFRADPEWEGVFLAAASRLKDGAALYEAGSNYVYPPFMAWAAVPLAGVPLLPGRAVWWAVNAAGLIVILRGAWRLAGGGRLEGEPAAPWREHLAAVVGGAGGLVYVENCLAHRQTDVVMGALLIAGCLALRRARALAAATCFGLAAAMKCTPLLWAPYLLWRGRPGAAGWLVAVALAANLLPDWTHPARSGRPWLVEHYTRYLAPLTRSDHVPGTWASDIIYNQSLAGACNRWLLTELVDGPAEYTVQARPSRPGPAAVRTVALGVELLLVAAVLLACGRPFRPLAGPDRATRETLEYSVVLLLMLLFSPMSSKAHFGVLVLPGFLLGRAAFHRGGRGLALCLLGASLMTLLAAKDPLGSRAYTWCLWCGSVTLHALFLLVGCLTLLARRGPAAEAGRVPWVWPGRRAGQAGRVAGLPARRGSPQAAPAVGVTAAAA